MGRVALAAGHLDEAEAAINRSLSTFAAGEALAQAARSRLPLAEIRAARGDPDAAAVHLAAAVQTFAQMHAPILVERARRLAQDLGVTLEVGRAKRCREACHPEGVERGATSSGPSSGPAESHA